MVSYTFLSKNVIETVLVFVVLLMPDQILETRNLGRIYLL